MTLGNELRPSILFGDPRTGHKQTDRSFSVLISLVVPLWNLLVDVMVDVIIPVQGLCLTTRLSNVNKNPTGTLHQETYTNPHGRARVHIWFRYTLLLLIAPPEPASRCQEMLADLLICRMHQLRPRVRRTQCNETRRPLRLFFSGCQT